MAWPMRFILALAVPALALAAHRPTSAPVPRWDACGHKTVAAIALQHLKPATRDKVLALFAADPRGRQFVDSATWPDDIKQGRRNDAPRKAPLQRPWHYVNVPCDATPDEVQLVLEHRGRRPEPGDEDSANVVTAIRFYTEQLQRGDGDACAQADALSWLIHLVGDIHQPLHTLEVKRPLPNYTPPPEGDRGGNGFKIKHPTRQLHALWDEIFDLPTGGARGQGRDSSDQGATALAATLQAQVHPHPRALERTDPADWARESFRHRAFVYSPPLDPDDKGADPYHLVTADYLEQARALAAERVVVAGRRLALLLERIFARR